MTFLINLRSHSGREETRRLSNRCNRTYPQLFDHHHLLYFLSKSKGINQTEHNTRIKIHTVLCKNPHGARLICMILYVRRCRSLKFLILLFVHRQKLTRQLRYKIKLKLVLAKFSKLELHTSLPTQYKGNSS